MAQVVVTMESDVAKLIRDQERVIKRQEEMITKFRQTGTAAKGAGDRAEKGGRQAQDAFGPRLSAMVTTAISQFATVTTAINVVTDALRFMREETEKAKAAFDRLADSRRRLTQVAVTPEDLQALEDRADQLAAEFGVDRDIVRQVIFSARSEGFEDVVDQIIAANKVVEPTAAATVAGQIPGLFGGEDLSPLEAVNAVLAAAQKSRADFEAIARAMPGAAEGAAQTAATPAEVMALMSVLPTRFKTADTTADRIKAIGTFISLQPEFEGMGIVDAVEQIAALSAEQRSALLGSSQELNVAFKAIRDDMVEIRDRQRQVEQAMAAAGTQQSALAIGAAAAVDESTRQGRLNRASIQAERSRIEREIAAERSAAESGFAREAAVNRAVSALQSQGDMPGAFAAQRAGEAASFLGLSPELTERTAVSAANPEVPLIFRYGLPGIVTGVIRGMTGQNRVEDIRERPWWERDDRQGAPPPATQRQPQGPTVPTTQTASSAATPGPDLSRSATDLSNAAARLDQAAARLQRTQPPRPAFAPRQRQQPTGNQE